MKKRMFIGIDVGGTHLRTALINEEGAIHQRQKKPTNIALGAQQAGRRLIEECRTLMEMAASLGSRVEAIGLGVAGKIDPAQGRVVFSPNLPALKGYPLAVELREALKLPVIMENDANAFALGENWMGAGRHIRNWIALTLGTGVGGALILDGRLWNGDGLGFAGEIGHMIIHPDGPRCVCGLRGCLEAHASGRSLVEGVADAISRGALRAGPLFDCHRAGKLEPVIVYQHAREGDPTARSLLHRMGWALGLTLASLFTVLGMRHAIIAGGVSAAWDQFEGSMKASLERHSSMLDPEVMVIQRSELGDDAALLGAAWLARQLEPILR